MMKRISFSRFLLFWAVLLLVVGAVLCVVLYKYCGVYEVSRPEILMDSLMENRTADDWLAEAKANVKLDCSEFENPQELFDNYISSGNYSSQEATYRKDLSSSTDDLAIFTVRSGNLNIAKVVLEPVPGVRLPFSRHEWQLGEICSADILKSLSSVSVEIKAPAGEKVFINGREVGNGYITGTVNSDADVSELEKSLGYSSEYAVYRVGSMYGSITVSDSRNNEISPGKESSASSLFFTLRPSSHRLTVTVPEGSELQLNGVTIPRDYIKSQSQGLFEEITQYTDGNEFLTDKYVFENIYSYPEVRAFDKNGTELSCISTSDGFYAFFEPCDDAVKQEFGRTAEDFMQAYINYSSGAFNYGNLFLLTDRTLGGTKLYYYFFDSDDAMIWASSTKTEFKNVSYDNFRRISDKCFICTVTYDADATATTWKTEYSYDISSAYELAFVNFADKWYCASMSAISE